MVSDERSTPGAGDGGSPDTGEVAERAPVVSGDDVRVGPESSDEPEAGTTEPTD